LNATPDAEENVTAFQRMGTVLLTAATLSCGSDKATGPTQCAADVGTVTATVSVTASTVSFDWSPRCAVAMVLVEEDASDMWAVVAPDLSSSSTESANIIGPPVVYGQVPAGAEQTDAPLPLVAGTTYELVLWRVLPAGSSAVCQAQNGNACLLAVKTFQR
jgi:hypothetical protein